MNKKRVFTVILSVLLIVSAFYIVYLAKTDSPLEVFGQSGGYKGNNTINDLINGILD